MSSRLTLWLTLRVYALRLQVRGVTLTVADVNRMSRGESITVGKLALPTASPLQELVALLVHADVILTYAHLGSAMTMEPSLMPEATVPPSANEARFAFEGSHEYYTNERNVDSFSFEVAISNAGEIVVVKR